MNLYYGGDINYMVMDIVSTLSNHDLRESYF